MTHRGLLAVTIAGLHMLSPGTTHAQPPNLLPDLGGQTPPAQLANLSQSSASSSANQYMAQAIAVCLRESGQLRHYTIDIRFQNGIAILSGRVASDAQRQTAVRLARAVDGVDDVREQLLVENRLLPAQALDPLQLPEMGPIPQPKLNPMDQPMQLPTPNAMGGPAAGGNQEPEPIYRASQPDSQMQPPLLPPYAWPTYAPYNNYSRVAYPTLYPYEAWPFIGPCYPFPKVPLGWRKVTLSWEDGYWWYARNASGHDWWRIRYW